MRIMYLPMWWMLDTLNAPTWIKVLFFIGVITDLCAWWLGKYVETKGIE